MNAVSFSFLRGVQAFQYAFQVRLASGPPEPVLSFYCSLPDSLLRPFAALNQPSFFLRCALNPQARERALELLGETSRSLFGRELRPSRLLEAPRREAAARGMILEETLHMRPATLLIRLLGDYQDTALWVRRADGRRQKCTTSITSLLSLALRRGEDVSFDAEGEGAHEMLDRLDKINAGGWRSWETAASVMAPSTGNLTLEGVVACVAKAMERFGVADLCGVLDLVSRRLFLGRPEWGHGGTALAAGIKADYGRINFTRTDAGEIRAYFPENVPLEDTGAYLTLKRILGAILS